MNKKKSQSHQLHRDTWQGDSEIMFGGEARCCIRKMTVSLKVESGWRDLWKPWLMSVIVGEGLGFMCSLVCWWWEEGLVKFMLFLVLEEWREWNKMMKFFVFEGNELKVSVRRWYFWKEFFLVIFFSVNVWEREYDILGSCFCEEERY